MYLVFSFSIIILILNIFLFNFIRKNRISEIVNFFINGLYSKDDYLLKLLVSNTKSFHVFTKNNGCKQTDKEHFWQHNETKDKIRRNELILGVSRLLNFNKNVSEKELYISILNWHHYIDVEKVRNEVRSHVVD